MYSVYECVHAMQRMLIELDVSGVIFVTGWTAWKNKEYHKMSRAFLVWDTLHEYIGVTSVIMDCFRLYFVLNISLL